MGDNEVYEYGLNAEDKEQTLKMTIKGKNIFIVIDSADGERYSGLVALSQIKKVCKAFSSTKTLKEALVILHNTIEGGNIFLTEDKKERCIELKFAVKLASGEFPPFSIFLELEAGNSLKESKQATPQAKKGHKGKGGNKKGEKNEAQSKAVQPQANPNIVDSSLSFAFFNISVKWEP